MPMGPFELLDEVGLDIAAHAADSLHAAYGERMTKSASLAPLVEAGELGKKSGRGIFLYEKAKKGRWKRIGRNPRLVRPVAGAATGEDGPGSSLFPQDLVDRCVLAMVAEAARCLAEDVVAGPRELDLATVFGMGFAPFRGGLWRYVESRGLDEVRRRLAELADAPDVRTRPGGRERFTPAGLLA
jgi:3-hydroxyacyl-CoA dehydrogenase/enoyl-CoA hydratase/3-hydroxybutyryl-CoA epimerase